MKQCLEFFLLNNTIFNKHEAYVSCYTADVVYMSCEWVSTHGAAGPDADGTPVVVHAADLEDGAAGVRVVVGRALLGTHAAITAGGDEGGRARLHGTHATGV